MKFSLACSQNFGPELILQKANELVEVVTKIESTKQAKKSTVQKTVKKQVGGSKTVRMQKLKTTGGKLQQDIRKKKLLSRHQKKNFLRSK